MQLTRVTREWKAKGKGWNGQVVKRNGGDGEETEDDAVLAHTLTY